MKRKIRVAATWLAIILITVCTPVSIADAAGYGETDDSTVDFILVLDCSGSMNQSDSNGMSLVAAELFIDLLPEENTRVGVVGFGKLDWGDQLTTVAYPLTAIDGDTAEKRDAAKAAIEAVLATRETSHNDTFTTVGYALEQAEAMLEEAGSQEGKAAIILLSDGRLTDIAAHSDTYSERVSGYDGEIRHSKTLEGTIEKLKVHNWPVYSMELAADLNSAHEGHTNNENGICQNYADDTKGVNVQNAWLVPSGQYQMQHIAEETGGGDKITVFNNNDIREAFGEIIGRFYDVPTDIMDATIQNGNASVNVSVDEMTAEMNIAILGQGTDSIASVALTAPDGETTEYKETKNLESKKVTFKNGEYILIKLLMPKAGEWNVTVYGQDGISISVMLVPMRQVNLALSTTTNIEEEVSKGTNIDFYASFMYNDSKISSDNFYKNNPCTLVIAETGERIQMNGESTDNYSLSYKANKTGDYTVYAEVESDRFLSGKQCSGEIIIHVDNSPVTVKEGAPLVFEMNLNDEHDPLNCTDYFEDKNGDDEIKCEIKAADPNSEIDAWVENGLIYIKSGSKASGEEGFQLVLSANDGYMSEDVVQELTVVVKNSEMEPIGNNIIKKDIEIGGESEINLNEYFRDDDNIPIDYKIQGYVADNGVVDVSEPNDGIITLKGIDKGKVSFEVMARDHSDSAIQYVKSVEIEVKSQLAIFMEENLFKLIIGFIVAVALLFLAGLLKPRKQPYGEWEINITGGVGRPYENQGKTFHKVTQSKNGKYELVSLLNNAGVSRESLPKDSENLASLLNTGIQLKNTNGITKGVKVFGQSAECVTVKLDGVNKENSMKGGFVVKKEQKLEVIIEKATSKTIISMLRK